MVLVDGKLLVKNPRDPECDAARALLARGYTGKLTLCDGKTGIPRTIIDIERAARKKDRTALAFRRYRAVENEATAPERIEPCLNRGCGLGFWMISIFKHSFSWSANPKRGSKNGVNAWQVRCVVRNWH